MEDNKYERKLTWRASEVLEENSICLFGTDDFTRDVAIRMSNLARATNPFSKILSSNAYSIAPDKETMLLHLVLPGESEISGVSVPRVLYSDSDQTPADDDNMQANLMPEEEATEAFVKRLTSAITVAKKLQPPRLSIELPGKT